MTKHPKSAEAWAYRKWLLALGTEDSLPDVLDLASLYPRNYYAWSYVHVLITTLAKGDEYDVEDCINLLAEWIEEGDRYGDGSALHALATLCCLGGEDCVVAGVIRACAWMEDREERRMHESLWVHLKELGSRGGDRARDMVLDWIRSLPATAPTTPTAPSETPGTETPKVEVYTGRGGYVFQLRTVRFLTRRMDDDQ